MPLLKLNDPEENRSWKSNLGNWAIYATASGATLALSTSASASVIYNPTLYSVQLASSVFSGTARKTFPVALGVLSARVGRDSNSGFFAGANLVDAGTRRISMGFFHPYENNLAKLYPLGALINPNASGQLAFLNRIGGVPSQSGAWFPGTVTGFVGFRSNPTGDLGWIEVRVRNNFNGFAPSEVDILGSAYNDVSGAPIRAGEVPEPGTAALLLLGAGAAGLAALRRRRSEAGWTPLK